MEKVKLKDICKSESSNIKLSDIETNEGNYNIYGASGLIKKIDYYKQEKECLAIVKDGAGVGRVFILPEKSSIIGTMQYIKPNDNINTKYLYYVIKFLNLSKYTTGATIPHIYFKIYSNEIINYYDLPTQEKIVKELDKINEIIDKKKQQLADLDTLIKSQFTTMFGNKYSTKPLNNVCEELFAGGDVNKDKYSKTKTKEFQIPIFTNGEKDNGLYGFTDKARVFKKAVTISGRGTIGFTCLRENPFYPAVRLLVAVPNEKIITATYLKYFIENKNYAGQGVSIPQLTIPMIKNERIPLPPIELQNKFAEFVKHIEKLKSKLKDNIKDLETLLASRMQHYFGE